mmetsp:Transcript_31255/g.70339  ORF Transcript_31255/g.70339 Transcript_31255/m.70339 type:complete len:699 (+) Transcript_31255:359-2455(+)
MILSNGITNLHGLLEHIFLSIFIFLSMVCFGSGHQEVGLHTSKSHIHHCNHRTGAFTWQQEGAQALARASQHYSSSSHMQTTMQSNGCLRACTRPLCIHIRGGQDDPSNANIGSQLQSFMQQVTGAADLVLQPALKKSSPPPQRTSPPAQRTGSRLRTTAASKLLRRASEEILAALDSFESRLERLKMWNVQFKRLTQVEYGDALYVVGNVEALGDGNPNKAIRMKHMGSGLWTVTVPNIPDGARYRYLIKQDDHSQSSHKSSEIRYTTDYFFELSPVIEDAKLEEGFLVEDDTMQLVRFKVARENAEKIFVVGSIPALGQWDKKKAVELVRKRGNTFEAIVSIPSDVVGEFEYKFFEYPSGQYESGPNRKSDAHLVEPQREFDQNTGSLGLTRVVDLESIWEGLLLRFLIYHPLQDPSSVLACSGSMQALGGWLGAPRKMGLGNERTLLTGVKGRCWEMTFPAPAHDLVNVQYRYCIIDGKKGTAVFEREPNRVIARVPGAQSALGIAHATLGLGHLVTGKNQGFRQREWQVYDGNFVPPHLSFDDVPPCLAIGPYPQSKGDVQTMVEAGVTGVLNVQTDGDHQRRMVNWDSMEKYYHEAGINAIRVPIEDFNGEELARLVKEGAKAVDQLVQRAKSEGKQPKVYIHCTAGMGRAPAVACVYLVCKHGFNLQDALAHVKRHRPVSAPNWHAMEQVIG